MATIGRVSGASFLNTPRLQYISTAPFYLYFYTYTTSLTESFDTVGTLTIVDGATPTSCPAGRILRENGRKLYPGANPGITTYMVGVYDQETFLSGFIDPNAQVFQIYNTDKPNYLGNGVEPTLSTTDLGPSIYTRGNVRAVGELDISGSSVLSGGLTVRNGATVNDGLTVSGGATVYSIFKLATSAIYTQSGADPIQINCSLANVFVINVNSSTSFTINATGIVSAQQPIYVLYNNTGAFTPSITMGSNIRGFSNGSGEQALTLTANLSATQQFISIAPNLCELSRLTIAASS